MKNEATVETKRAEVEAAWSARTEAVLAHGIESEQARMADADFNAKAAEYLAAEK